MATIGGLVQPDILGAVNAGFDRGQEQRKSRILSQYAQGALGGDQSALSQIYQADPQAGLKIQQQASTMGEQQKTIADKDLARLGQHARLVTALADAGDLQGAANLYKTIYPEASKILGPNLPPNFDPSMVEHMKQIANSIDPQTKKDLINLTPGSTLIDPATGKPVYSQPAAPQRPQLIQTDQGWAAFDPSKGTATPVNYAGQVGPSSGGGLADAVMQQESGGDPNAVSPKGAQGLMQLMPGTAADPGFGVAPAKDGSPQENMRVGKDYLGAMQNYFGGNTNLALAAYNAGPGRVSKALKDANGDPAAALATLPAETQSYVPSVLGKVGEGQRVMGKQSASGVPSGYRPTADGKGLEPIPGGPADKSSSVNQGLSEDAIYNAAWSDILMGKSGITGYSKEASAQRAQVANVKAKIAKEAGVSPQELATTQGRNKALQASLTNLQKQSDILHKTEETFRNNADLLLNLSDKVSRSGAPALNKFILNVKNGVLGDPDTAAFAAARNVVAQEYSKIASGATGAAGTTQGAQEHALELINNAHTPEQLRAVIDTLNKDIDGQQKATEERLSFIHQSMGQFGTTTNPGGTAATPSDNDPLGLLK